MDNAFRRDLTWAMKKTLLENLQEGNFLVEEVEDYKNWILNEATYEQLLNLCFNNKEGKYYEASLIESLILTEVSKSEALSKLTARQERLGTKKVAKYYDLQKRRIKADIAGDTARKIDAFLSNMGKSVRDYFKSEQGKQTLKYGGLAILGAVALGVAANFIYKRYFSAAAKACKNAKDVKACMKKFEKDAIKKTIQKLKQEKAACSKTAKPEKCSARLDKEIKKWQAKLQKV